MSEETTPTPVTEATPAVVPEATPAESGSQTEQTSAPEVTEGAESHTPEQIAEWQRDAGRVKDAQAEITRAQQENAELRGRQTQLEGALGQFVSREQQRTQADPIALAQAELQAATTEFDPDRIAAATNNLVNAQLAVRLPEMQQNLHQQGVVQQQLERAKEFGDYTPDQLRQTYNDIGAQEVAMIQAHRDGKLHEMLNTQVVQREQKAADANRLNSIMGRGTPGMAPGSLHDKPVKSVSFLDLASANMETRKHFLENEEFDVTLKDLPEGRTPEQAAHELLTHKLT